MSSAELVDLRGPFELAWDCLVSMPVGVWLVLMCGLALWMRAHPLPLPPVEDPDNDL